MKKELIKIDKGIPIPPPQNRVGTVATMRRLNVGDSFLTSSDSAGVYTSAKLAGIRVAVRKTDTDLIRIWRIK